MRSPLGENPIPKCFLNIVDRLRGRYGRKPWGDLPSKPPSDFSRGALSCSNGGFVGLFAGCGCVERVLSVVVRQSDAHRGWRDRARSFELQVR